MVSTVMLGSGHFTYGVTVGWEKLPPGYRWREVAGVVTDSKDNVYVFNRGDHPMIVFDRGGNFIKSWGEGVFVRPHGVTMGPDETLYCTDDGDHTVRQCTLDGRVLMTIGVPGKAAEPFSGVPFNRCTHVALDPDNGDLFISDGYGNSRIHKYSPDGKLLKSWGEPGIAPGQFLRPHNIAVDDDDRIIVADREAHRVQVFDTEGNVLDVWNNIFLPNGMTIGPDGNIYIGELPSMLNEVPTPPNMGHNISIMSPKGEMLARIGHPDEGEEPGMFIAPHVIGVDSHGDIYVGEVSFTIRGSKMDPPKELRSLSKLRRVS